MSIYHSDKYFKEILNPASKTFEHSKERNQLNTATAGKSNPVRGNNSHSFIFWDHQAQLMYLGKLLPHSVEEDAGTWQIGNESKWDSYSFYSSSL